MNKVALIGNGHIGKKHIGAIDALDGFELRAIVDRNQLHPSETVVNFVEFDEFLNNTGDVALASICTPNHLHAAQAIACMDHGMHVLIEKPMALSRDDAEQVIATSLQTNKRVFCVMQLRYSPIFKWLKEIISSNALGTIFTVDVRCYWNRNKAYYQNQIEGNQWRGSIEHDGGPLFTQFSHFIDLIYHLFGKWNVTAAEFQNYNHKGVTEFEDTGQLLFKINDISGSMYYTTATFEKNFESTISITGEKGIISIGGQYFNEIRCRRPDTLPNLSQQVIQEYSKNNLNGHIDMYKNIESVLNSSDVITTNAMDGLKVVEMIEEVYGFRR